MRDNYYAYGAADKLLVLAYVVNVSSELTFYLPKGSVYKLARIMQCENTLLSERSALKEQQGVDHPHYFTMDAGV